MIREHSEHGKETTLHNPDRTGEQFQVIAQVVGDQCQLSEPSEVKVVKAETED